MREEEKKVQSKYKLERDIKLSVQQLTFWKVHLLGVRIFLKTELYNQKERNDQKNINISPGKSSVSIDQYERKIL